MNAPVPHASLEPIAQRVARLQLEARNLATQHVIDMIEAMQEVARMAAETAGLGESVPPGVRDLALRLAEDVPAKAQTIAALMERKP